MKEGKRLKNFVSLRVCESNDHIDVALELYEEKVF